MAQTIAQLENALSQGFENHIFRQWNRQAVATSLLDVKPGMGKNAAWDVAFSGAVAGAVSEGSDVTAGEFSNDVEVPAVMPWCNYRTSFQITEQAVDAAASSIGIPQELEDMLEEKFVGCSAKLISQINGDVWSGTGSATGIDGVTSNTLIGFTQGALSATGSYAGISRSQFAEWAGNTIANGGIARPLSKDLIDQGEQNIFTAAGEDFDWIITSAGVYRKYEGLFTPAQRQDLQNTGTAPASFGMGVQPAAAGQTGLFYKGKPVFRDKDCPAGTMLLGKNSLTEIKYLPRQLRHVDGLGTELRDAVSSNGDGHKVMPKIQFRVTFLAKTGDSYKFSVKATIALLVKRPNGFALIKDISEV